MSPLDTPVALLGIAAMFAATLGVLTWGLTHMADKGDRRPLPPQPAEYEHTADRWRPHQRTERDDWPYDQELDAELRHAEDWLSAWADEQRRGGAA